MASQRSRIWLIGFVWLFCAGHGLGAHTEVGQPLKSGEHTVQLNGMKLWYKVSGAGPVCIMPSPWVLGSDSYFLTLGSMEKIFTVVYLDSRGTGRSGRPKTLEEYGWHHLVGDVEALRVHLKQDRVWLMGHCMGGSHILHYACKYPARVSGLVLLDAIPAMNEQWQGAVKKRIAGLAGNPLYDVAVKAWPFFPEVTMELREEDMAKWQETVFPLYWSDPRKIEQFSDAFAAASYAPEVQVGEGVSKKLPFDLRAELRKVTAPALIVHGEDDRIAFIDDAMDLHSGLSNSKLLLIEKSGHFPWLEQPEIFEARVPAFLQALGLAVRPAIDSAQVPKTQGQPPIIDMHLHTMGEWDYPAPEGLFQGLTASAIPEMLFKETYEQFRELNVVKAVVCGPLDCVERWKSQDEDGRIIPGLQMHAPNDWEVDPVRFESLVKAGKIKVFGEVIPLISETTLSDPEWQPYLEICEQYDIPVLVHTSRGPRGIAYTWAPKARFRYGEPYLIEDVLIKYPKLRLYMGHSGVEWQDQVLMLMDGYPQLYTDLAAILWIGPLYQQHATEFLAKAKEGGLLNRVMFGSDQLHWPHAIKMSIDYLNSLDFLTEKDKRDILYNNAATFLRLKQ